MKFSRTVAFLSALLMIAVVSGCGGSSEEAGSAGGTIGTASVEIEGGDPTTAEAIEAKIEGWKQLISEKEAELAEIAGQLETMTPADLQSDEAKSLEDRSAVLTRHIGDMEEKIEIAKGRLAACRSEE